MKTENWVNLSIGYVGMYIALMGIISCGSKSGIEVGLSAAQIREHIDRTCRPDVSCTVPATEIAPFSWDKLIVFDITAEPNTISEVIGKEFSPSTPFYSRKWFFMQDEKVVHFEEQTLPAIDEVMKKGDIEFDVSNSKEQYAIFDRKAIFGVKRIAGINGEAYSLSCVNCQ